MQFDFLRRFQRRREGISRGVLRQEFRVAPVATQTLENKVSLWDLIYRDNAPWLTSDVRPLGVARGACQELTRAALVEAAVTVSGSARGEFIGERLQAAFSSGLPSALAQALALGGMALKPVYDGRMLSVEFVDALSFTPTDFDGDGNATAGVFRDLRHVGDSWYVRLEEHAFDGDLYVIRNKAYTSGESGVVGHPVPLETVPEWATLYPEAKIAGLDKPLFGYFKAPAGNVVDDTKVGVSIYAGATVGLLRQADEQWGRILWEYRSAERKIFVDGTRTDAEDFDARLFEFGRWGGAEAAATGFYQEFNPALRDDAYYRGFQHILQRIEFNTGLAFGDIADPQVVDRTATEIRTSKQRKYVTVSAIQRGLQNALDRAVYAMDTYCDLYGLQPKGDVEAVYVWGDSILSDPETDRAEKAADALLVSQGLMEAHEFRMKWNGESEEEARSHLGGLVELEGQDEVE